MLRCDCASGVENCSLRARIVHTSGVRGIVRSIAFVAASGALSAFCQTGAPAWQSAVDRAARRDPEARIVVFDIASGRLVGAYGLGDAARTLAAPGSTLKPLVLYGLVSAGRWNPANRVACNRQLVVAGHRLACTHPLAPPFDAREALTWSCNSYFAAVARTLVPGELGRLLRPTGLLGSDRSCARGSGGRVSRAGDSRGGTVGVVGSGGRARDAAGVGRGLSLAGAGAGRPSRRRGDTDSTRGARRLGQLRHGRPGELGRRRGPGQRREPPRAWRRARPMAGLWASRRRKNPR